MKYILSLLSMMLLWSCANNLPETTVENDEKTFPDVNALSGSYANMIAAGDHLYVIGETDLITYEQQSDASLQEVDRQTLGLDLESLYYRNGVLFVGSSRRMYICQLDDKNIPVLKSREQYIEIAPSDLEPCDPIVANDELAIVSLSSSRQVDDDGCRTFEITVNELRFYNITDLTSPELINTVEMENPKGMALDGNLLFVCEKDKGLKVLDITNALAPVQLYYFEGFDTYDAVATGSTVLIVGESNLYEFDYSDPSNIHQIWSVQI